jgi:hypothetical protein
MLNIKPLRFNAFKTFLVSFSIFLFLAASNVEAHSPHTREALAIIQKINRDKQTLTLNYSQGHGPRTVVWHSDTIFLCDWKTVPATNLMEGAHVTIYYRSPFFGKPFVLKILWTSSAPDDK